MKQTEEIKAMIHGMMAQEMENYKEAVSNGEADETASPVVYTIITNYTRIIHELS